MLSLPAAGRKELIRWLNRPITKDSVHFIIDGVYFKLRRKRVGSEATLFVLLVLQRMAKENSH
ncbi:MAG: hypothetical protein JRI39_12795 [Deltaproteobacteria bacterium]|nr:hypothetical protein [Deltaproteobacteria bacterium]